jgi:hypothetical protein
MRGQRIADSSFKEQASMPKMLLNLTRWAAYGLFVAVAAGMSGGCASRCGIPRYNEFSATLDDYRTMVQAVKTFGSVTLSEPVSLAAAASSEYILAINHTCFASQASGQSVILDDGSMVWLNSVVAAVQPLVKSEATDVVEAIAGLESSSLNERLVSHLTLLGIYQIPVSYYPDLPPTFASNVAGHAAWSDVVSRVVPRRHYVDE